MDGNSLVSENLNDTCEEPENARLELSRDISLRISMEADEVKTDCLINLNETFEETKDACEDEYEARINPNVSTDVSETDENDGIRVIEEEKLDFDIDIFSSSFSDINQLLVDDSSESEEEIFIGNVCFSEKCVSKGVDTIEKESSVENSSNAFSATDWVQICLDAKTIAHNIDKISKNNNSNQIIESRFKIPSLSDIIQDIDDGTSVSDDMQKLSFKNDCNDSHKPACTTGSISNQSLVNKQISNDSKIATNDTLQMKMNINTSDPLAILRSRISGGNKNKPRPKSLIDTSTSLKSDPVDASKSSLHKPNMKSITDRFEIDHTNHLSPAEKLAKLIPKTNLKDAHGNFTFKANGPSSTEKKIPSKIGEKKTTSIERKKAVSRIQAPSNVQKSNLNKNIHGKITPRSSFLKPPQVPVTRRTSPKHKQPFLDSSQLSQFNSSRESLNDSDVSSVTSDTSEVSFNSNGKRRLPIPKSTSKSSLKFPAKLIADNNRRTLNKTLSMENISLKPPSRLNSSGSENSLNKTSSFENISIKSTSQVNSSGTGNSLIKACSVDDVSGKNDTSKEKLLKKTYSSEDISKKLPSRIKSFNAGKSQASVSNNITVKPPSSLNTSGTTSKPSSKTSLKPTSLNTSGTTSNPSSKTSLKPPSLNTSGTTSNPSSKTSLKPPSSLNTSGTNPSSTKKTSLKPPSRIITARKALSASSENISIDPDSVETKKLPLPNASTVVRRGLPVEKRSQLAQRISALPSRLDSDSSLNSSQLQKSNCNNDTLDNINDKTQEIDMETPVKTEKCVQPKRIIPSGKTEIEGQFTPFKSCNSRSIPITPATVTKRRISSIPTPGKTPHRSISSISSNSMIESPALLDKENDPALGINNTKNVLRTPIGGFECTRSIWSPIAKQKICTEDEPLVCTKKTTNFNNNLI